MLNVDSSALCNDKIGKSRCGRCFFDREREYADLPGGERIGPVSYVADLFPVYPEYKADRILSRDAGTFCPELNCFVRVHKRHREGAREAFDIVCCNLANPSGA